MVVGEDTYYIGAGIHSTYRFLLLLKLNIIAGPFRTTTASDQYIHEHCINAESELPDVDQIGRMGRSRFVLSFAHMATVDILLFGRYNHIFTSYNSDNCIM